MTTQSNTGGAADAPAFPVVAGHQVYATGLAGISLSDANLRGADLSAAARALAAVQEPESAAIAARPPSPSAGKP